MATSNQPDDRLGDDSAEAVFGLRESPSQDYPERLRGDAELMYMVRAAAFRGPVFDKLIDTMARYGLAVIGSWLRSGEIFDRVKRHLGSVPMRRWPMDYEDASEITSEVVATALHTFRRKEIAHEGWDPRRGASLATYFTSLCIYSFPNVYRRWARFDARQPWAPVDLNDEEVLSVAGRDNPEAEALTQVTFEELLKDLTEPQREILYLKSSGWTTSEIASFIGMSPRSVEGMIYRLRRQLVQRASVDDEARGTRRVIQPSLRRKFP